MVHHGMNHQPVGITVARLTGSVSESHWAQVVITPKNHSQAVSLLGLPPSRAASHRPGNDLEMCKDHVPPLRPTALDLGTPSGESSKGLRYTFRLVLARTEICEFYAELQPFTWDLFSDARQMSGMAAYLISKSWVPCELEVVRAACFGRGTNTQQSG